MTDTSLIIQRKSALRVRMKAWRAGVSSADAARAAEALASHGIGFLPDLPAEAIVSGFASMPEELRMWPLLRRLARNGVHLALPVIAGKGEPLLFRAWAPGDKMDSGVWGIAEPKTDKAEVEPDVMLVPLLAFDRQGWRLGYGGGFYDRSIAKIRALKPVVTVGLAYDGQEVEAVPRLDYDERLDWVLTPSGPIACTI